MATDATTDPAAATAGADPAENPAVTVSNAIALKKLIAEKGVELKTLEAKIVARGPGKYSGVDGQTLQVVAGSLGSSGSVAYSWPAAKSETEALEIEAQIRKACGEKFGDLFDRWVTFTPCEGFGAVAPKLLTKAKARDVLKLCRYTTRGSAGRASYILYPME